MASIDNRVVSMVFDNKKFEENASTTISTLGRLKQSLNFSGAAKGFEDISAAASRVTLGGIGAAVDNISNKFNAMGAVAASVINNITTRFTNAAIQLGKGLSLDQVISGFQEYETNIGSIQTILSNTMSDNTTLEDVNKALDELNKYSDQTIYNFGEMTRNIGTFTAAGIDLDTSTTAIKGIANLAAISGSNSQQASTAMYQLSQALAAGSVKLMDWNSVVTAGMGGEVFQKALFETGKTLGTIKDVPIDQTFEQWTAAGNTFRGSLQDGWITSEVLTNTLQGFTGDLTDAQLKAMGYTDDQIVQIQKMGKNGKDAATKVKTLTQLISTVKESIGSGWSQSFRTVVGDFEEARKLFTNINAAIKKVVDESAESRNELLQGWKELGGRTKLIGAFRAGIIALARVLGAVKDAFREIFPAMTAERLYSLTERFNSFMKALKPSKSVLVAIRKIFKGVFSIVAIGIEIFKGFAGVVKDLVTRFVNVGDAKGGILGFLANIGQSLFDLKKALVDGKVISEFFANFSENIGKFLDGLGLNNVVQRVVEAFKNLKGSISDLLSGDSTSALGDAFEKIRGRFQPLINFIEKLGDAWDWLVEKTNQIKDALSNFGDFVSDKFGEIPQLISDAFAQTDYDQALDTINTGLFAGLVALVAKIFKGGGLDLTGGFLKNASQALESLTGVLDAMQTKVKADAIFRIAAALGLLVLSLVVLALIDSAALTKALVGAAAGIGILVAALAALDTLVGTKGAAKLVVLGGALILIAAAITFLAIGLTILSKLSWGEIGKGLVAVAGLLLVVSDAVKMLSGENRGLIKAGIGILFIGFALIVLAGAVKLFSMMSWAEIGKGLAAIAAGLLTIAAATKLMPNGSSLALQGLGILQIAIALNILAGAIKLFSMMSWEELGRGLAAAAGALIAIAVATKLMPNGQSLALQGAGILLIAGALFIMTKSIKELSSMSWGELARGLVGIAAVLLLLTHAAYVMQGSLSGAIAIGIIAVALKMLAEGIEAFAAISWADLLKGLIGIAAVFAVIGGAAYLIAPILPALFGLAVALALIGAGFALFGLGANLLATAFSIFATAGTQALDTFAGALTMIIELIPAFLLAIGKGIIELVKEIAKGLPGVIAELSKAVGAIIQLLIDNIPALGEAVLLLIETLLNIVIEAAPDLVTAGLALLSALLQGISDNIFEITNTVVSIILQFLTAMTERLPEIVQKGTEFLVAFLNGIANNLSKVVTAAGNIVTKFIEELGNLAYRIVAAGADALIDFLDGVGDSIPKIAAKVTEIITEFTTAIANETPKVVDAGFQMFIDLFNGLADTIRNRSGELGKAMGNLISAIIEGIADGLIGGIAEVGKNFLGGLGGIVSGAADLLQINSPSKVFRRMGESIALGLDYGIRDGMQGPVDAIDETSNKIMGTMSNTMVKIADVLKADMDASPKIRPVVDLSGVSRGASEINDMLRNDMTLTTGVALSQATAISASANAVTATDTTTTQPVTTQITFEQNNYSPESLSSADIYRQTRNQIAMAKEELANA